MQPPATGPQTVHEVRHQRPRRRVGPVQVLQDDHERGLGRQPVEEPSQGCEDPVLVGLGQALAGRAREVGQQPMEYAPVRPGQGTSG